MLVIGLYQASVNVIITLMDNMIQILINIKYSWAPVVWRKLSFTLMVELDVENFKVVKLVHELHGMFKPLLAAPSHARRPMRVYNVLK